MERVQSVPWAPVGERVEGGAPRDAGDEYGCPAARGAPRAAWLEAFRTPRGAFARHLRECYGDDEALLARRTRLWRFALERFRLAFGESGEVVLIGVPSRVNWEGHHVDHQGGHYNATTDERETVAVVRPRADPEVRIENVATDRFPPRTFPLDGSGPTGGKRDWASYVKGAYLALEARGKGPLIGMDAVIGSDIPIGVGLSSSHALVLAAALAAAAVCDRRLGKKEAVSAVQDGEWFVGSRTGLGDQAAMIFGRRGCLFSSPVIDTSEIAPRYVRLPAGYAWVLIDSFTKHQLHGADRLAYNAQVFAYRAAFPLVLDALRQLGSDPDAVRRTRRLAEIDPRRFSLPNVYRALARLPDRMTVPQAETLYGEAVDRLVAAGIAASPATFTGLLDTYFPDGVYPSCLRVKGVALYGLAECWRSRLYADLIAEDEIEWAGRLVYRGHDGDRVVRRDPQGRYARDDHRVVNRLLERLARDAERGNPERALAAGLEWQAGDYSASTPELDRIVDLCRDGGAASASLTGAGLGGVVAVMIECGRLPALRERVLDLFEDEETAELHRLEAAHAQGTLGAGCLRAAREIRAAKRATRGEDAPFVPDPGWQDAIEPAAALRTEEGDPVLRLLPVDYYRRGVWVNRSIAGAGYLVPPEP